MLPKPEWCSCKHQGICMGCMIEKVIQEKLGEEGYEYLSEFIPTMIMDEEAAKMITKLGIPTKVAKTNLKMNMQM